MTVEVVAASTVLGPQASNLVVTHTGYNGPTTSTPLSVNFVEPPIGPGSLFHAKLGNTFARFNALPLYVFNDFTFELGLKIASSPAPDNFGRILDNNHISGVVLNYRGGNGIAIEGGSAGITTNTAGGVVTLDAWQHWAFKRQGTQLKILRNGVVITTAVVSANVLNIFTSGADMRFGVPGGSEVIQAYTSDFRIWNYARSDAEILGNYQVRMTGSEPGLVCYYPLAEPDSVFKDRTGNNIILELFNGASPGPPNANIGYSAETPPWFP